MPALHHVALLGFTAFERETLAACFRLDAVHDPAYVLVDDAAGAELLLVDADHAAVVKALLELGRVADAVFVGSRAPEGATAWMTRPIDPRHVVRELDAIVAARSPRAAVPPHHAAAAAAPAGRTAIGVAAPRVAGTPGRRAGDAAAPPPAPAPPAVPAQPVARALLVDDSAVALRFLQSRLQRYGLATVCVPSSGKAIEELAAPQGFDFIFLDVELGSDSELDGLALCQYIKRLRPPGNGEREPLVTLVSAHQGHVDRTRGALAGADAYLGKPIDESLLHQLLQTRGLSPRRQPTVPDFLI